MSQLLSRAFARPAYFVVRLALIGFIGSAGALGLSLVGQTAANATPSCDRTWTGAVSSSWTVAGNWTPSGAPSSSQYACITGGTNQPAIANGATLTIAGMQLSGSMTLTLNGTGALTLADTTGTKSSEMSGGTVQGGTGAGGTLTIGANHVFNWTGGNMTGPGSTVVALGGTANLSPTNNHDGLDQRSLTNNGSITYSPSVLGWSLYLGNPTCSFSTTITNNGTFTYNGLDSGDPGINACGTATIANNGTFTKTAGTATPGIGPSFNNSGTVTSQAGTLALTGGSGSGTGSFGATGGGVVSLAGGTFNLGNGSTFTGGVSIDGATVTLPGAATLTLSGTNGFSNGTIDGAGTMTVNGTLNWTGGNMQGSGSTIIAASGQGVFSPTNNHDGLDQRSLTNNGSITYSPSVLGWSLYLGNPTCSFSTTITNNGTFTYNGLDSGDPGINACGTALIHNSVGATFSRSGGTATAVISPALDNDGTLTAAAGVLSFQGGGGTGETGTGIFGTSGGGQVSLDSGTYHLSGATFSGEGAINGATLFADGPLTVNSMAFANGTIDGTGTMTVNGTLNWTGGNMQGSGSTIIALGGTASLSPTNNHDGLDQRSLTNNGSITYSPSVLGWSLYLGNPTCSFSTTITNNGTFTYNGLNSGDPGINACGTATITNNGTFTKSAGTSSAPVSPDFDNNGTIAVQTGTLQLNGAFPAYNSGTKTLTKGTYNVAGTLQWVGADVVANAATISLDGAGSAIQSTSATNALANFASNSGSLTVKNGRSLMTKAFTNTGTVVIGPGTNSTLTAPGAGYTQNTGGASTALTAASSKLVTSAATGNVTINGGTLSGIGTVQTAAGKTLTNGATVSPGSSPGTLSATANYAQTAGGSLPIEIGGATQGTQYDLLAITGNASLNGTLALSTINGFVPTAGQTFTVLTYTGTRTGTFSSVTGDNLDGLNQGLFYKVVYDDTSKVVKLEVHQAQLAIGDVTLTEPNAGTLNADFAVTLTDPRSNGVSVNYATSNGTAAAPADYTATSGTLTWASGDAATKHIMVPVKADALDENNETFTVSLSANSHASIQDGSGLGTIQDDAADLPPTISINDVSQNEGNSGTSSFGFTASLSAPSGKTITANYGTADGSATAPSDYATASGGLTFNAGDTSKPVSVTVNGDTTIEPNETFLVNLTSLVNVTAADVQGQGTILNDDSGCSAPVVSGYNKPALAVGKKLTITGVNFTGATAVAFTKAGGGTVNGTAMQVVSDTTITVKVPNLATTGIVQVTTPCGTGSGPVFKVKATIADFNPKTGPVGTQVIITGTAFTGTTKVQFGTKTASFTVNNDGQITTTVPAGATTAIITITTPGGKAKTQVVFTVT